MKIIFGFAVLIIILSFSVVFSFFHTEEKRRSSSIPRKVFETAAKSLLLFSGIHLLLAFIAVLIWVFAWIGILIKEMLQWLVEAFLSPYLWVWNLF